MESDTFSRMKINWVLGDLATAPAPGMDVLKHIGPTWGSWRTWRSLGTDNVICWDYNKCVDLLARQFQRSCNFYIPDQHYQSLDRPPGVRLYNGDFNADTPNREEIIALHLVSGLSDIVLVYGVDWNQKPKLEDRLLEHQAQNYRNLVKHAIKNNPQTQWVLIDHSGNLMSELEDLENFTQDSLDNVLKMLAS